MTRGNKNALAVFIASLSMPGDESVDENSASRSVSCVHKVDLTVSLLSLFSLYGRHMQANPEPPKKNNDKSKKISRKPLTAKNK